MNREQSSGGASLTRRCYLPRSPLRRAGLEQRKNRELRNFGKPKGLLGQEYRLDRDRRRRRVEQ